MNKKRFHVLILEDNEPDLYMIKTSIAEAGVDYISSGAITHSASNLDVALDF